MKYILPGFFLMVSLVCGFLVLLTMPAHAYIGPGLGVAAIWILLGPLAAIIILILIIAYFPARYWFKKWRHSRSENNQNTDSDRNESTQASSHDEKKEDMQTSRKDPAKNKEKTKEGRDQS